LREKRGLRLVILLGLLGTPAVRAQEGPCTDSPKDDAPGAYKLFTGPKGEYYAQVGRALTIAAGHKGLRIACRTSNGSVDNIRALESGKADFALVQSDAAHLAWFAEEPFENEKPSSIKLIAPLFAEKLQILVRPHLYVTSPAGLQRPKSVWMGATNSGSHLSALMVLQASGKTLEQAKNLEFVESAMTFEAAQKRLRSGQLDAIFRTSVAPTREIVGTLANKRLEIRLLGLDEQSMDLLVNNGMYIETSLQKMDYQELKAGLLTVGVEALLLTRDGVDGDDIASLADMLKSNQSDLETHLQRVLAGDYEAGVDAYGESPAPAEVSTHVVEPSALTLLGTRVRQPLLDHVDLNATQYLWKFPIRKEAAVRMLILSALLVVCTVGLLHPRGRRLAGKYARAILAVLASVFIWMIIGAWLQALEGGLNQNFTTLPKACWALAENLVAKLQLPLSGVPTATTRQGATVMNGFIWICVILLTTFAYPWLKKVWQSQHFPPWRRAQKAEGKSPSDSGTQSAT
jgi:TRAP transporter TAXI family solute receptor